MAVMNPPDAQPHVAGPPGAPGSSDATAFDATAVREHLVASRLAGSVATSPRSTIENCGKLVRGEDDYHFGLPDWRDVGVLETLDAVRAVCGGDPGGVEDLDGPGWIDPDAAVAGIERHRQGLAAIADAGGGRVLLATGHPTGLLAHYAAIGRWLAARGCALVRPLDDEWLWHDRRDRPIGVRYVDRVAVVHDGGSLRHTHRSVYMEAMLDRVGVERIDLVVADHGMAGAAIAAGITTLSIADVNDPGLPLAQVRGRTDAVLPIDDNLAPSHFEPVTAAMLNGHPHG